MSTLLLVAGAEKDGLINSVREEVAARGLPETKETCWQAYVARCRANLHVVLAMSPVGELLRTRCRNFPGMVNNTVIDWFEPWPEQALKSVASVFLKELPLPEQLREGVCVCVWPLCTSAAAGGVPLPLHCCCDCAMVCWLPLHASQPSIMLQAMHGMMHLLLAVCTLVNASLL